MRLELQSVRFKNFLCFGAKWQEVPLLSGVNLILGVDKNNDKSNGSGKSSLLEAIPFTLFGKTHKNINKDDIINWKNRKACQTELDFKVGEHSYLIKRGIKPDLFEIYKDGDLIPKPSHIRDYQKNLEDIIGINFQTFMSLVHTNINSSAPILEMSKPDKRKFMEKIFGLNIYSYLVDRCNEKLRTLEQKIRETNISIDHNHKSISYSEDRIRKLNANIAGIQDSKSQLNDLKERLSEKSEELKDGQKAFEEQSEEYESIKKTLDYLSYLSDRIKNKNLFIVRRKYNEALSKLESKDRVASDLKKLKELKDRLSKIKRSDDVYNKSLKEVDRSIETYRTLIDDFNNKKLEYEKEISREEALRENYRKQIEKLEGESKCPLCESPIDPESIKKKMEKSKSKGKNIKELKGHIINFNEYIKNNNDAIKELREQRNKIIEEREQVSKLETEIASLSYVKEKVLDIKKASRDKNRYYKAAQKLEILVDEIESTYNNLESRGNILYEDIDSYKQLQMEVDRLDKEVNDAYKKVEMEENARKELESLIEDEKNNIATSDKTIKLLKDQIKKFNEMIDYLNFIKTQCKDENLKQYAISSIMPYLNNRTNHYLSKVGFNFYIVLDKWLESVLKGPGITKGTYGNLSGGERRSIDLSLQLAFLDVARVQAGIWPDIVVFDELLDSSVDGKGLDSLLDIVVSKQQEDSSKIFIISHRSEVSEIEFDNTYFVEKTKDFSTFDLL